MTPRRVGIAVNFVSMPARSRPRNRRAQIATVAAEAFDAHGYHGVGMDGIAATVGISGPALYRHFPSKYALFRTSVETLVAALDDATAPPPPAGTPPGDHLDTLLHALAEASIEHRRSGGLYRWQARLLRPDDRHRVNAVMRTVNERLAAPIAALHPRLGPADIRLRTTASLSILGSITGHRAPLARRRIAPLLVGACRDVIACPAVGDGAPGPEAGAAPPAPAPAAQGRRDGPDPPDRREVLLAEALRLFARRGYHEAGIEEIAAAAGLTASGVYRHFDGKPALLDAAFQRVAAGLGAAQQAALAAGEPPAATLAALSALYARSAFRHPDQLTVYFAEVANLPPTRQRMLRAVQRGSVDQWAALLVQVRPALSPAEARYLVYAVFAVILDTGRSVRFDPRPQVRAQIDAMNLALLFGPAPDRSAGPAPIETAGSAAAGSGPAAATPGAAAPPP